VRRYSEYMATNGDNGEKAESKSEDARVRTHLANERTFLAWLRTALTAMTLGLAAIEFLTGDLGTGVDFPITRSLAVTLVLGGLVILGVGVREYMINRRKIREGDFEPASSVVIAGTIIMAIAGCIALLFVLLVDR
jgi:putative membrane protein